MARRGNKPVEVRVDDETRARWESAARDAGQSLSVFVRDAVEAVVSAPAVRVQAGKRKPSAAKVVDRAVCPRERFHRPGTFCKECGKTQ